MYMSMERHSELETYNSSTTILCWKCNIQYSSVTIKEKQGRFCSSYVFSYIYFLFFTMLFGNVDHFSPDWNILTTIKWIWIQIFIVCRGRILLTLMILWLFWHLGFSVKVYRQLLDRSPWNSVHTFMSPTVWIVITLVTDFSSNGI